MRPQFDERDQAILDQRVSQWNERKGPRVGDFVRFTDGSLHRFTYDWHDGLQTAPAGSGSYYLGSNFMSYSGSLDPRIGNEDLRPTNETMEGRAWFFHHDWAEADNAVYVNVPCRVFLAEQA